MAQFLRNAFQLSNIIFISHSNTLLFFENYVVWLNDILIVIQKPKIILYLFTKSPAHLNILFESKLGHNETERKHTYGK